MTGFIMAWTMFLAIPCPIHKWDEKKKPQMLASLPFIGLTAGGICCGIYAACRALHLGIIGLALTAVMPWLVTGFMHLDGFMDCADAVLSFRDRERKLEILKDSHVGSFAVICMAVLSIFTFAAWLQIAYSAKLFALVLIPAASRAVTSACVLGFKPLSTSSYASTGGKSGSSGYIVFCAAVCVAACAAGVLLCGLQGIAVIVSAICTLLTILKIRANLGGMSGDISGCGITIGECCAYIALAVTAAL